MRAKGNQLPQARLTPELVKEIRANRQGMSDLKRAQQLGVNKNTVTRARLGETWGHL